MCSIRQQPRRKSAYSSFPNTSRITDERRNTISAGSFGAKPGSSKSEETARDRSIINLSTVLLEHFPKYYFSDESTTMSTLQAQRSNGLDVRLTLGSQISECFNANLIGHHTYRQGTLQVSTLLYRLTSQFLNHDVEFHIPT